MEKTVGFLVISCLCLSAAVFAEDNLLKTDKRVEAFNKKEETNLILAKGDIAMLETALTLYELDNGFYPSTSQGLVALIAEPGSNPRPTAWNGPYATELPEDPWENSYHYVCPGVHSADKFDIYSYGPDEIESNDDIRNW